MANPYYVAPLGGLQNYASIGQTLAGGIQQSRQQNQQQALQQEAQRLMREGTPQEIAAFSAANPQIGQAMQQGMTFANQETERNMQQSMQRVIAGEDPVQVLQDRIAMVESQGGDATETRRDLEIAQQDPQAYRDRISRLYALRFGEEGVPGMSGGPNIGTYNPRDYTTESFAEFTRTNDPAVLERYTGRTIDVGGVPYREMPDGTLRRLQIPGAGQGAQPEEVTTETVAESRAAITGAEAGARQDVEAQSPEAVRKQEEAIKQSRMNISSTEDVVNQADAILNNEDFISSLTGTRGMLPAVPGTTGFDAEVAFDRLKNTLTLGNLDKMSGVLSESDIKILRSAAGGLEAGMSEQSFRDRLQEIRSVFDSKTKEEREKLRKMMTEGDGRAETSQSTPRIRLDAEGNIIQ